MNKIPIYSISSLSHNDESINAKIKFDASHSIFKGHFPGNPIVPGVIQVQVIKDLLEKGIGKELMLGKSKNIKFLNYISPLKNENPQVIIEYQVLDNIIKTSATISSQEVTFLKFLGDFSVI